MIIIYRTKDVNIKDGDIIPKNMKTLFEADAAVYVDKDSFTVLKDRYQNDTNAYPLDELPFFLGERI